MDNLLRQIKLIVYRLKRQFGLPVTLRWSIGDQYDSLTGETFRHTESLTINRAILLPDVRMLVSSFGNTYRQVTNAFTYGAVQDQTTRIAIIDAKDVQDRMIQPSDQIIARNVVYRITRIEMAEELAAYLVGLANVEAR